MSAYQLDPATIQQTASQVITKMKSAGVTTIILSGDPVAPRDFTKEATAQEYFPEWVIAASTLVDVTAFARTYDQEQWSHAFGVTQLAARSDPTTSGAYANYKWFTGVEPPANDSIGVIAPNPALFFAVVQAVGPNLTAETFRDTLFAREGTLAGNQPAVPLVRRQGLLGWRAGLPGRRRRHGDLVGCRRRPARTRSVVKAPACTSTSTVASATCPANGRPRTSCSTRTARWRIYPTPPPGEERGDYPSPAG